MGFTQKIKIEELTAAARHCCVCHKYKGVKIEVHHIIQEANGGPNTSENAIVLCFDCHSDAGHYNDNHPKGTKFSVPELRNAKEEWKKIVKEHKISAQSNTSNHLHFRHLILRDYEIAMEVLSGDLKNFPFPNSVLYPTDILRFIKSFSNKNKDNYLSISIDLNTFQTKDEILSTYSDIEIVDKSNSDYPYFYAVRTPKKEELLAVSDQMNPFILHFFNNNIEPKEYCQAVIYEISGGCGGGEDDIPYYHELIVFKSFWFSFLAITNTASLPIELLELEGDAQNNPNLLTNVLNSSGEENFTLTFPKISILPNETILMPTGLILVPINEEKFNETILSNKSIQDEMGTETLTHFFRNAQETSYSLSGKYLKPKAIKYNISDRIEYSEMHELDLNNFFVFDRIWAMGSCPHLFYKKTNSRLEYVKELFTRTPGIEMLEQLIIPENINELTIAELEHETTYISEITINYETVFSNIVLNTNENITFKVNAFDLITLRGYYISFPENIRENEKIFLRNRIIGHYLREHNQLS